MPECVLLQRDNIAWLYREIRREITSITLKRGDATFSWPLMEEDEDEDKEKHTENKNTITTTNKRGKTLEEERGLL